MKKKLPLQRRRQLAVERLERREVLASLQLVPDWGAHGVPSTLSMYAYVPDRVAPQPPIMVLCHYWGGKASDVFAEAVGGGLVAAADQYGFIIVVPQTSNPDGSGRGWDANSAPSLLHNGGGETQGIAQMVQYAISAYHANPERVYVTGPSSGGMMTEVLLATYPDIFKAGVEFAGVPAGAWAAGNPNPNGWSNQAAAGQVTHTAQEWGDIARAMDPGYSGPRPRVQLWHGTADTTINYNNQTEAIKQWTNVLGLSSTPTSTATVTISGHDYTHQAWVDALGTTVLDAWSETSGGHGTDALLNASYVIPFMGLDRVGSGALSSAQDSDIGSPSPVGSSSYNADTNTYTVSGGGAGVGGASDQFHYFSQGITGDGTITASVTSLTNTSTSAQAGVMFRDSTAASGAFAYAFVTPSNNVVFTTRAANGVSSAYSATVAAGTSPIWVRISRAGSQFTAQYSLNGTSWTQLGTTQTVTMSSSAQVGLAVSSNNDGTLCTSTFSSVQLQSWGTFTSNLDIGAPSPAGSGIYDVGTDTYTVAGGGADIWGTSDQFHYLSKSFAGNGSMTARVTSITNTNVWAKAGPMFRDGTAANAAFADVLATPGSGVSFQWRSTTGANPGFAQVTGITAPVWLRLIRAGNQFSGYYSLDNATWTQIGTAQTVTLTNPQVGLAVTSHNNGTLSTTTIDHLLLDSAAPTVATAASASPSTVVGTTASLSVLGADDGGESNLTYTWSLTGTPPASVAFTANGTSDAKNTVATFSKAGTYNFSVTITDQGGLSTTSSVSVTVNQTLTGIAVTSAVSKLIVGQMQQFSAVALDQFGNAMTPQPTFTWSLAGGVGSINASGLYTASAAGSATVLASSSGVSGVATLTVVSAFAAPTVAKAASVSAGPGTGTSANLSVLGAYEGGESSLTYTWSLTGAPPAPVTFSANGTNAAKNTTAKFTQAGVYNFAVTITDLSGRSATSWVAVQVTFGLFTASSDIGAPALAGSLNFNISSAAYTVTAGGTDVSGTADQFRFNSEAFSGNGQFTARVTSVSNAGAKAGLMFRDSAAANAAYAFVWATQGNNVTFETRASNGAASSYSVSAAAGGTPWVRLIRSGSQFTAQYSLNGTSWTNLGTTQTVTMATSAQVGLAVCSHNAGVLNTSVLDNVTLGGLAMRGRPTLNAAHTTFVADNGQLLRGPFTSTEWTGAIAESDLAMIRTLGFNAVHLYGESFDPNYPNAGSTAPGYAAARIDQIVQEAQNLGLYVVLTIGNGANNGNFNLKYVQDFWTFYAPRYANATNVLFEIQNEPVSWGPSYVTSTSPSGSMNMEESAYNIIRTYAPNTPVLLFSYAVFTGSGGGNAALNDIHAFNQAIFGNANASWNSANLAVAFHGYGDSTQTPNAVQTILNAGYPAFMTEFAGSTWGNRFGGLDVQLTAALERMNVSWMTFEHVPPTGVASTLTDTNNFVNPVEATGLGWTPDYGNWPGSRGTYGNGGLPWATPSTYVNNQLTGTLRIEAENYDMGGQNIAYYDSTAGNQGGQYRSDDVDITTTNDAGGGYAVSSTAGGEYLEYTINVPQPGYYNLALRYASAAAGAMVDISSQFLDLTGQQTLPSTGSLATWSTLTTPIFLGQGRQVLHLGIPVGGFNLNWLELTPVASGSIANGTYMLVNRNSGQAMQFDTTNNVVVQQPPTPGSNIQQWTLQNLGAGQYKVTSTSNGYAWNANGGTGSALGMTSGWSLNGAQMFILQPTGDGLYAITTVNNGTNLDISSGSTANGAGVVQDSIAPGANQQWAIIGAADQVFPGGLVAFRDSAGKVQLSWSTTPGATSYNIKRATSPGGPYTTIATNVAGASYVDNALRTTTYYYVVSAVNSLGKESLNSFEVGLALPRAQLKFDESAGTTATDASGNGWNGTLQNGAAWSVGLSGNALSLNGSGAYASLPTGVVNGLSDFTISTWVNLATNPSWARIFDFGTGTNNYMFLCANPNNANALRFAINTGSGEQQINGTALTLGTWTHVAVTMVGGVGTLYINGLAVGTNPGMTLNPSSLGATTNNYIGKSQFNDPSFNGKVDDFRIYASGLSGGQVASLYKAGLAPSVVSAASANPAPVAGTTTQLSVSGADIGNEAFLKYAWFPVNPPAPVTFTANGTNAAKNTTATFSAAGTYQFIVAITDVGGFTASSSVAVTVNPTITSVAVAPSSAAVTVNTTKQFTATAYDQFGLPLAAQPSFTWSLSSGGGSVSANGLYAAPSTSGFASVQATAGTLSAAASINVTTQVAPAVVNPASASPSPAGTSAGLSVLGSSSAGEPNLIYTWSLSGSPPAPVTFSANGTNAAKNSTATFSKAGTYNFTVTITDQLGLTSTSSVTVVVAFGVLTDSADIGAPALVGSLAYNTSTGVYTVKGGGADIWGTSDQFRYAYTGYSGDGQVSARAISVGNTNQFAKAGVMFRDSTAANAAYAYAWVSPSNNMEFETRSANGVSSSYTVTVTPGGSPVWVRLVRLGNQFTASYSLNGTTWTQAGTTQTVTMATAALGGVAVTSHNTGALNTSVLDNVALGTTPNVATPAAASPSLIGGSATNLSVLGSDDAGESNLTYTWATAGAPPAPVNFSVNGTGAAKNTTATFTKAGIYDFIVTIKDVGNLTTTSTVQVTVQQTLTSIAVSPATVSLNESGTQQFTATANDQFGTALSSQPSFNWSTTGGMVDATGLYTAPFASGSFQVTAASGAFSNSATTNVTLLPGDTDGDGQQAVADVGTLMTALSDVTAYQTSHNLSPSDVLAVGNLDGDAAVTNLDLQAMVVMLANAAAGGAPPGLAPSAGVSFATATPAEASSGAQTLSSDSISDIPLQESSPIRRLPGHGQAVPTLAAGKTSLNFTGGSESAIGRKSVILVPTRRTSAAGTHTQRLLDAGQSSVPRLTMRNRLVGMLARDEVFSDWPLMAAFWRH
jgi:endoglucanase